MDVATKFARIRLRQANERRFDGVEAQRLLLYGGEGDRPTRRLAIAELSDLSARAWSPVWILLYKKETRRFRAISRKLISLQNALYTGVRCGLGKETWPLGDGGGCDLRLRSSQKGFVQGDDASSTPSWSGPCMIEDARR